MQTHVHSGALFGIDALPPDALVSAVHEETEGNPFFVTEVVRLLASDGRLERADDVRSWTFAIPQGVREVLGRRLDRLSPDCNQVLTMASVIGREFSLESLGRVSNVPRVRLLTLLEEAVDARVIDPIAPVAGRFSFAHRLVRETLYDELTAAHRITLHRRVGEVIESLHAAELEPHLAALAYHFFEASLADGDVGKAIDYARRAGDCVCMSARLRSAASRRNRSSGIADQLGDAPGSWAGSRAGEPCGCEEGET